MNKYIIVLKKSIVSILIILLLFSCAGQKVDDSNYSMENMHNMGLVTTDGEFLYYISDDINCPTMSIHRSKLDGSDDNELLQINCSHLNIINDWIYYVNVGEDKKLYRINKFNLLQPQKVFDFEIEEYAVYQDKIYALSDDHSTIYAMNIDGENISVIVKDKRILYFYISLTDIYIVIDEGEIDGVYRINNFMLERMFSDDKISWISYYNDSLYYICDDKFIKCYNVNTSSKSDIVAGEIYSDKVIMCNGSIYYSDVLDLGFYRYEIGTKKIKKLKYLSYSYIFASKKRLYYYLILNDGNLEVYTTNFNGGDKKIIC